MLLEPQITEQERWRIGELIDRLKRKNFTRQVAEQVIESGSLTPEMAGHLLAQTSRKGRWRERALMAWCLGFTRAEARDTAPLVGRLCEILGDRPSTSLPLLVG